MQQVQNEGVNFYLGFTDLQIMALNLSISEFRP